MKRLDPSSPWHLGLTGGIGSGKSTVAEMLARRGAAVVDADAISRALTMPGGAAMPAIAEAFGESFVTAEGALDRQAMRQLVFEQAGARARLEAIVHPLVGRETARRVEEARRRGVAWVVFDVPLLVESGRWRARLDAVWVVDCPPEEQVARVMRRSGWPREQVQQVLATQATRLQRLAAADAVLYNPSITLDELALRVEELCQAFGL